MAQEGRTAAKGGFWSRARLPGSSSAPSVDELDYISTRVLPLSAVFSDEFRYKLTCFQRTYSWRTAQVTRLIANVREAMAQPPGRRRYCLGRLMLAKTPNRADTELVDGHQRLITLTMLFAVLRDLEINEERRAWLQSFIVDGTSEQRSKPSYRVTAQATPSRFFETQVQALGATDEILSDPLEDYSETERNIYENRETIRAELTALGMDDEARRQFADFLAHQCHVIAIIVADQDQAWELVHIEQETRLEFSEADQAKAILLSAMPMSDRITCSRMWEGCEALLSSVDMHRLLVHIGAMKWRCRFQSSIPIETDIINHFALEAGGFAFMDQEFVPNAERLSALRRGSIGAEGRQRAAIATSTEYMSWIEPHLWVPAALKWLEARGENDAETELFFRRLDRLVWMMKIAGEDPGVQETRIFDICDEIAKWVKVEAMTRLQIEAKLHTAALTNLRSINFAAKHYAGLVLRRLSILLGADSGPITRDTVTMEHVLPRNPPQGSGWRRLFRADADIKDYAQRLGNISLLSGPQNQKAGTLEWNSKRAVLSGSDFVLSRQAASETTWDAKTILRRSENLIGLIMRNWELGT